MINANTALTGTREVDVVQDATGTHPSDKYQTQYSIASLMCFTGTIAVMLTYVRFVNPNEFVMGISSLAIVSIVGVPLGYVFQRTWDVTYWSVLGALTAFLCAVDQPLTHPAFHYAWPLVGALSAATAILLDHQPLWLRIASGAVVGTVVLSISAALPLTGSANVWVEVACGPIAGALMVAVVALLESVRIWRNYSRSMLVLTLTIGVIGGNVLGRTIGVL